MTFRPLLAITLLAACASPDSAPRIEVWRLQPVLSIGGAETGAASFGDIRGLVVDKGGRIYTLDGQAQRVTVFRPSGDSLRVLGRQGAGPGEFTGANGIALGPDGDLWAYDPTARRLTAFDSSGALTQTLPLTINSYGYLWDGGVDSAGNAYDVQTVPTDTGGISILRRIALPTLRIDTLPLPSCGVAPPAAFRYPGGFLQIPYAAGLLRWFDLHDRVWCANTGSYTLRGYAVGGDSATITVVGNATPVSVSAAERDSGIAKAKAFMKDAGPADLDFSLIPSTKPLLRSLERDRVGRLWVRLESVEGSVFDVFAQDGVHLAHGTLPIRFARSPHWIIDDTSIVAVALDSVDAPIVVRLRIVRPR